MSSSSSDSLQTIMMTLLDEKVEYDIFWKAYMWVVRFKPEIFGGPFVVFFGLVCVLNIRSKISYLVYETV